MTILLSPQLESRLVRLARLSGLAPDALAELLLNRVLIDSLPESQSGKDWSNTVHATIPAPILNGSDEGGNRPRFGSARGMITMTEDFDEPLDDFKEYMY